MTDQSNAEMYRSIFETATEGNETEKLCAPTSAGLFVLLQPFINDVEVDLIKSIMDRNKFLEDHDFTFDDFSLLCDQVAREVDKAKEKKTKRLATLYDSILVRFRLQLFSQILPTHLPDESKQQQAQAIVDQFSHSFSHQRRLLWFFGGPHP